jgi:hypothetical protein
MNSIYLVLAAAIGLLIGLLVANLINKNESKQAVEKKLPKDLAQEGYAEVARILYSPSGKKIATELDGEFYRDFLILSPEQKKRVVRLVDLMQKWTEKPEVPSVGEQLPVATVIVNEVSETKPPIQQPASAFTYYSPAITDETVEVENGKEEKPLKPTTVAGQISAIIDEMIQDSSLKEKGIKLIENERQGVDVWIGLEKFDGINAIPYPDVQELIRKAVIQWEKESETLGKIAGKT